MKLFKLSNSMKIILRPIKKVKSTINKQRMKLKKLKKIKQLVKIIFKIITKILIQSNKIIKIKRKTSEI